MGFLTGYIVMQFTHDSYVEPIKSDARIKAHMESEQRKQEMIREWAKSKKST